MIGLHDRRSRPLLVDSIYYRNYVGKTILEGIHIRPLTHIVSFLVG